MQSELKSEVVLATIIDPERPERQIALKSKLTRKLCYRKDYCAMRVTTQSDNTHMVCC